MSYPRTVYRYAFATTVAIADIEASLLLAILATEDLHGASDTRLDAMHCLDAAKRACVIDGSTEVGRDLNRLFVGLLARRFGPAAYTVRSVFAKNPKHSPPSN